MCGVVWDEKALSLTTWSDLHVCFLGGSIQTSDHLVSVFRTNIYHSSFVFPFPDHNTIDVCQYWSIYIIGLCQVC